MLRVLKPPTTTPTLGPGPLFKKLTELPMECGFEGVSLLVMCEAVVSTKMGC